METRNDEPTQSDVAIGGRLCELECWRSKLALARNPTWRSAVACATEAA